MKGFWVGDEQAPILILVDHLIAVETRVGPPELGSKGKPVVKGSLIVMTHGVRFEVPQTVEEITGHLKRLNGEPS